MSRSFPRPAPMIAVLFGLSLAGCAAAGSTSDEARAPGGFFNPGNYVSSAGRTAGVSSRGGAPIAALPASAGRVVDVREKRFANGLRQEIALAADSGVRGENVIVVAYRDQPNGAWGEPEVELPKDRDDDIATELQTMFPGGAMRVQDVVLRNAYGSYGLASGRLGAANCVYMWQSIADLKSSVRVSRVSPYAIETTVRVRLCRSGVGIAQLAQWASNVIVDVNGAGQPVQSYAAGAPLAGDDALDAALETRPRGARSRGFSGYAVPPSAASSALVEDEAPRRLARPVTRTRVVTRYVRVRRSVPREAFAAAPQQQPQQVYVQQPQQQIYGQPGQPVWIQPGAAALAQTAGVSYGGAPAASNGSVALPPQAFGGPAQRGYLVAPR